MNAHIVVEQITEDIEKLSALEESLINAERMESSDLKSKQTLLLSEVIQSLQKVKTTLNTDA
jgi:4-hydroxyphenylpyruvate dioxygenase-like putative hemolysin